MSAKNMTSRERSVRTPTREGNAIEAAEKLLGRHLLARGFVLGAAVTAVMALFIFQNREEVDLVWLWIEFRVDAWLALLAAFLAGAAASALLALGRRQMRQHRDRQRAVLHPVSDGPATQPPAR